MLTVVLALAGSWPAARADDADVSGLKLKITPQLAEKRKSDTSELPTFMSADTVSGQTERETVLTGNAQVRRGGMSLRADTITYNQVDDEFDASGNVRYFRRGDVVTGPRLHLNVQSNEGTFLNPEYRFIRDEARGNSERIDFQGNDRVVLTNSFYTTCPVGIDDWYVKAGLLTLDYGRQTGVARDAVLFFKDVPILAVPMLSFPLDEGRQSGFLTPTFGVTSKSGAEFMLPYYFNIAPNRDATLYPRYIDRRGVQLGAEVRYLEPDYRGEVRAEVLPHDEATGTNRYLLFARQAWGGDVGTTWGWNGTRVSDDAYLRDFSRSIVGNAVTTTLPREMWVGWRGGAGGFNLRSSKFQTLQDPLAPITPPYDRSPQLSFWTGREFAGADVGVAGETTRFTHPTLVSGNRTWAYPSASFSFATPGYYVTPKLGLHLAHYEIDQAVAPIADRASRSVPIMSVDSGMVLERDTSFYGKDFRQTLEPRLYYLRVPYRDQSALPNFDSGVADFNFAQIFSENLFAGWDRIADANQLTAAVTSRLLDPATGAEKYRFVVGQRQYFNSQRVTLPGVAPHSEGRSDILLAASGEISPKIMADLALQYNPQTKSVARSSIGARWTPEAKHAVSVGYRLIRGSLEQVDAAGQWPLAANWYAVARMNYSLADKRVVESIGGLEYDGCCWVLRVVAQRYAVATQNATSALYVQLELNGFSRLGSNPLDALKRNIPGYQPINQQMQKRSEYDSYE